MTANKIDWYRIRNMSLYDYVVSALGEPKRKSGQNVFWNSPLRSDDRTPSFTVNLSTNRWTDFGGPAEHQNCSIIDFVQCYTMGMPAPSDRMEDVLRAYEILTGEVPGQAVKRQLDLSAAPVVEPATEKPLPSREVVMEMHSHKAEAVPYFLRRHISELSIDNRLLGSTSKPYCYERRNGEKVWSKGKRYSIPWIAGDEIRSINMRLDEDDALAQIALMNPEDVFDIRMELAMSWSTVDKIYSPEDVTDMNVVRALYGPKYMLHPGSRGIVFNVNRLFKIADNGSIQKDKNGKPILRSLDTCLIFEGEMCAASLEDLGFAAVSIHMKNGADLSYTFSNVKYPIIVADSDKAGEEKALAILKSIKRGGIVRPLEGFKDGNEMVMAGVVFDWANSLCLKQNIPMATETRKAI